MSKPQRVCDSDQCQAVAKTGSRLCKFHMRKRRTDRARRAVAVRLERYSPEHCTFDGLIEELKPNSTFGPSSSGTEIDAIAITRTADSVTRAILTNQIDRKRAKLYLGLLQLSRNLHKRTVPSDPHLPTANQALQNLTLALSTLREKKGLAKMS